MRELFRRQPKFTPTGEDDQRQHVPERISMLADDGAFEEWDSDVVTADPLEFIADGEPYLEKARRTAERHGVSEAVVSGKLQVDGHQLAVVVTDFRFMGASMGSVYGEKLARACERAVAERLPLLTISASGGARMQEGLFSLMQMAKTTAALTRLGDARLPHLSLLTDPCYGGVTASYATTADVVMAEPGALIGFAGPRVIEQVTRQKLPPGFQTAEFLFAHGLIDIVVHRRDLAARIATLLELYSGVRSTRRRKRSELGDTPREHVATQGSSA
ncbi:MAG: acetyl-CoA carboxylase carboxyl transferase subunit beta [Chloroflexi bacterium]|nr:MAG: acetyl-CoA carboxylase carboxyl transferase subunit beta [Chloroflexota bacterium]